MEHFNRLATPRFRRFTLRLAGFEIELRTRPRSVQEQVSSGERAYRRARAEQAISHQRTRTEYRWTLMI